MKAFEIARLETQEAVAAIYSQKRDFQNAYTLKKWHDKWKEEVKLIIDQVNEAGQDKEKINEISNIEVDLEKIDYAVISSTIDHVSSKDLDFLGPLLKNAP